MSTSTTSTNPRQHHSRLRLALGTMLLSVWLAGCTSAPSQDEPAVEPPPSAEQAPQEPSQSTTAEDDLGYNLQRLSDRDYTQTYGDGENEKIWYTAAENLGDIGKPAIPHLIDKLESTDEHEVMLALYALQLASQDRELQAQTGNNYLTLPSVLNPRANAHNKAIALSWWQEYEHLWDE